LKSKSPGFITRVIRAGCHEAKPAGMGSHWERGDSFGVRRLVAALEVVLLARPGSLLPGIPQTDFRPCSQASRYQRAASRPVRQQLDS